MMQNSHANEIGISYRLWHTRMFSMQALSHAAQKAATFYTGFIISISGNTHQNHHLKTTILNKDELSTGRIHV